jgi:hypothetical protein
MIVQIKPNFPHANPTMQNTNQNNINQSIGQGSSFCGREIHPFGKVHASGVHLHLLFDWE